jgi:uncharacterized protein YndB with AHSA1/START domain
VATNQATNQAMKAGQAPTTQTLSDEREVQTMNITQEVQIAAPVAVVWETILHEIGPGMGGEKMAMPMKLEAWPGGRWFRDLGNNTGHLWGHVQVIKPPPHEKPLLEICGPMAMSYAVASHIQYRLTPEGKGTKLTLKHRAIGLIPVEHREGMKMGWGEILKKIQGAAEKKRRG